MSDDERRAPEGSRFRNGYRLLLGRRSQGVTGSASNGHSLNGHSLNGTSVNGTSLNGSSVDGAPVNGCNGAATNGHNGHGIRVGGHILPIDVAEGPVDVLAIQADDVLIDTVAAPTGDERTCADADDRLVALLAAWRAEVDATPIPELVDLDTAVAAVLAGVRADAVAARRRRAARVRHLAPLAAAAAVIVATVTGIGVGSQDAVPGDTLWPVQKVFNSERAESVESKVEVEARLENVRDALTNGDEPAAARELAAIRSEIPEVRAEEGQPLLVQEEEFLAAKLEDAKLEDGETGAVVDLSTPARSKPEARPTSVPTDESADPSDDADATESTSPSTSPSEASGSTEPSAEPSGTSTAPAPSSGASTAPAPESGLNSSGVPVQTAPGLVGPSGVVTSGPSGTTTSGSAGTNVDGSGTVTTQ